VAAPDAKVEDLAEHERLRNEQPGSDLEQRLAKLSDRHPSGDGYGDGGAPSGSGGGDGDPDRIEPLTDAEWAEHLAEVETKLDKAKADGLATHIQETIDPENEFWSDEREKLHDEIVDDLYGKSNGVPCEFQAVITGGLAGAGKTTILSDHVGIDLDCYLVINPDAIKEELARRGQVPRVEGLTPMEASGLAHEESSHIAKRLALRAQAEGKNVIWDVTMSSADSTTGRIDRLRAAGYTRVEGVFVDIPVEVSKRRADARHREDHEEFRAAHGLGGRYISNELVTAQLDDEWGCKNRRNFEQLKHRFDAWSLYDNSLDGRKPVLVAAAERQDHDEKEDGI
jgi:predicted kinase